MSLCVTGFPGTNRALTTLAQVSGLVRHLALADERPSGCQARFAMAHLEATHPRTVILGGWSDHYEPFLQRAGRGGPRWVVYWTSSAGQTDVAGEIEQYVRILADRRIAAVLYADARLARSPAAQLKASALLPVCALPIAPRPAQLSPRRGPNVISLFCSPREMIRKNPLNTLLALAGLEHEYVLHLNGLSQHAPYRRLLRRLGIPYRDFGWMERDAYERALADVDLGLQVSFAESHNQVAADHSLRGIPIVVSEMVRVLDTAAPSLRDALVVANPDDHIALRATIDRLLARPGIRRRVGAALQRQFLIDNAAHIRIATRLLRRLA
jgi:hypothetical protein